MIFQLVTRKFIALLSDSPADVLALPDPGEMAPELAQHLVLLDARIRYHLQNHQFATGRFPGPPICVGLSPIAAAGLFSHWQISAWFAFGQAGSQLIDHPLQRADGDHQPSPFTGLKIVRRGSLYPLLIVKSDLRKGPDPQDSFWLKQWLKGHN
ncbi:hypothetical protein [Chitinophaga sp. Ak27]|uniref:hypothetical protein n=1 Tax=Chitinophaga sp. Ak27 TaxID=2726116 RepID=UPI00145D305B|nr:hypothetical protein [Chitinophaga sp. Ak27]NLU94888.1 hypothetical protein [Chitinophaga sp. Ak27]